MYIRQSTVVSILDRIQTIFVPSRLRFMRPRT
jgi:hypothetical protein